MVSLGIDIPIHYHRRRTQENRTLRGTVVDGKFQEDISDKKMKFEVHYAQQDVNDVIHKRKIQGENLSLWFIIGDLEGLKLVVRK